MNNIIKNKLIIKKALKTEQITLAFLWGLAESSLFFIVPDVWLTIISRFKMDKSRYQAIGCAILGALVGGTAIYWLALLFPQTTIELITRIPGIQPILIEKVRVQVETYGLLSMLLGPLQGVPYKIYAAQWGIIHGNLAWFWVISIPARGIRFIITAILTRVIWLFGEKYIKFWNKFELVLLISFWGIFYFWYFNHFGY